MKQVKFGVLNNDPIDGLTIDPAFGYVNNTIGDATILFDKEGKISDTSSLDGISATTDSSMVIFGENIELFVFRGQLVFTDLSCFIQIFNLTALRQKGLEQFRDGLVIPDELATEIHLYLTQYKASLKGSEMYGYMTTDKLKQSFRNFKRLLGTGSIRLNMNTLPFHSFDTESKKQPDKLLEFINGNPLLFNELNVKYHRAELSNGHISYGVSSSDSNSFNLIYPHLFTKSVNNVEVKVYPLQHTGIESYRLEPVNIMDTPTNVRGRNIIDKEFRLWTIPTDSYIELLFTADGLRAGYLFYKDKKEGFVLDCYTAFNI